MDNNMTKLIAAIVTGCLLLMQAGCISTPAYKEKVTAYRPDLSGRYLGGQPSAVANSETRVNSGNTPTDVVKADTPPSTATMLKRGDQITIFIYGSGPTPSIQDVVDDNGNVNLPYIGFTKIGGLTTYEAEKHIEKTYIDGGFYKQIQVSVVKQFEGEYFVQGEVNNKQGVFPLSGDTTLLEAIAKAGGPTVYAGLKKVKLMRDDKVTIYNVKKMQTGEEKPPLVRPGDVIYIPKSPW
jgi:polysaccharide export outer membrane protein